MNKEEIEQILVQEIQWVQYRQNMLGVMEEKLLKMKQLAEEVKQGNQTVGEIEIINATLNNLAAQVRALDGESREIEDVNIL